MKSFFSQLLIHKRQYFFDLSDKVNWREFTFNQLLEIVLEFRQTSRFFDTFADSYYDYFILPERDYKTENEILMQEINQLKEQIKRLENELGPKSPPLTIDEDYRTSFSIMTPSEKLQNSKRDKKYSKHDKKDSKRDKKDSKHKDKNKTNKNIGNDSIPLPNQTDPDPRQYEEETQFPMNDPQKYKDERSQCYI